MLICSYRTHCKGTKLTHDSLLLVSIPLLEAKHATCFQEAKQANNHFRKKIHTKNLLLHDQICGAVANMAQNGWLVCSGLVYLLAALEEEEDDSPFS